MIDLEHLGRQAMSHCSARLPKMDELLEALVRISSGTGNLPGNKACLEILKGGYEALGFETQVLVAPKDKREHLKAVREGAEGAPKVVLLGHTDTVFDDPEAFNGYWTESGRARGPGVADMKGGLVVMLTLLDTLTELDLVDRFHFHAFINSDEEQQSRTSRQEVRRTCEDADLVLVFESGRPSGAVVASRRGTGRYLFKVQGRSAHAGNAVEEGRNAILELAAKIPRIESLTVPERGVTVNSGLIGGGTRPNVVPESAWLVVDVRCDDPAGGAWLDEQMREIADDTMLNGCSTTLRGGLARPPWPDNPDSRALVAMWRDAARAVGLGELEGEHAGGGSDGNLAYGAGAPVLDGLGPRGGGYHTRDEWIELSSLPQRAAMSAVGLALWREHVEAGDAPARRPAEPSRSFAAELQLFSNSDFVLPRGGS